MTGITFNTHFSRLGSFSARADRQCLSRSQWRQVAIDVFIVAVWAALIPSLLWLGHWMGY